MDVQALHALGRVARELSGQARAVGEDAGAARAVVWRSTRAQDYRDDLSVQAAGVQDAADELARAAAALHGHAEDVQHQLDQLSALASWFGDRVDDARRTVAAAADAAVDTVSDVAVDRARDLVDAARHMPSPGSLDWGAFTDRFR